MASPYLTAARMHAALGDVVAAREAYDEALATAEQVGPEGTARAAREGLAALEPAPSRARTAPDGTRSGSDR